MKAKKFMVAYLAINFFLCGCVAQNNSISEANEESAYTELAISESGEPIDEQYTDFLQDTLQNAFLEIEGIDNATVTISLTADAIEIKTDLVYAENVNQEKTKTIVESILQKFFSEYENKVITVN